MSQRFSKTRALAALDARAARIAAAQKFNRSNGSAQLRTMKFGGLPEEDAVIERAIEYGRMRAFEQFAEAIEENFSFDRMDGYADDPTPSQGGNE